MTDDPLILASICSIPIFDSLFSPSLPIISLIDTLEIVAAKLVINNFNDLGQHFNQWPITFAYEKINAKQQLKRIEGKRKKRKAKGKKRVIFVWEIGLDKCFNENVDGA